LKFFVWKNGSADKKKETVPAAFPVTNDEVEFCWAKFFAPAENFEAARVPTGSYWIYFLELIKCRTSFKIVF